MNINFKKGFTIIEVVLVLAIAGLIFLMVFIALPNMQRSQRDTQRRNDYSAFSTAITTYITNNNGKMPTLSSNLDKTMLNSNGTDHYGNDYQIGLVVCSGSGVCTTDKTKIKTEPTSSEYHVILYTNAYCDGSDVMYKSGSRNFAILGAIENTPEYYCLSSNN